MFRSSRDIPGWTRTYQFTVSTSTTLSILRMSRMMPRSRTAAPVRLLPAPLARIGIFSLPASVTICATSSSEPGLTTTEGVAS